MIKLQGDKLKPIQNYNLTAFVLILSIIILLSSACKKDSSSPADPVPGENLTGHFFGISPTYNHYIPQQEYQDYKKMGIRSLRLHYQDSYGDEYYDEVIKQCVKDSIEIMMLVSYESYPSRAVEEVPPWGGTRLRYTNAMDLIYKLAEIVPRFRDLGVHAWEIWNEENGVWYIPENEFALLMATVYEKFKYTDKWDADATIVFGGLDASAGPWDPSGSNGAAKEYLKNVYAAKVLKDFKSKYGISPFDAIAVHPYNTETKVKFDHNLADVCISNMTANGDAEMPLWITELGDASEDDITQADRLEVYVKAALAHLQVARLHWFKYTYPSSDAHQYYSIVMADGRHREAFMRYSTLIEKANRGELTLE
jgi:hypothetical protein